MRRFGQILAAVALLGLLTVAVVAQTPKPVRFVWDYTPAVANDTDLTVPSVGYTSLHEPYAHTFGYNVWQLEVTLLTAGVPDTAIDTSYVEFTVWGSNGHVDDSTGGMRWDSLITTDTGAVDLYNSWGGRGAVTAAADSAWRYRFLKVTAKWWDLDTTASYDNDTDSVFVTPPHFSVELKGKYE